ncbi:MAG: proteasome activator [Actinomycetota bacterium]
MTDQQPETPEIVDAESPVGDDENSSMTISEPAKVMRIGTMIRQLLEEVRATDLDEPGRDRLREIHETSVAELSGALSEDLQEELARLALPFDADEVPSEAELRIAQAQLVGWLEGLFHGIQATLFAQQTAARQQLELMQRSQALPPGAPGAPGPGQDSQSGGVYL